MQTQTHTRRLSIAEPWSMQAARRARRRTHAGRRTRKQPRRDLERGSPRVAFATASDMCPARGRRTDLETQSAVSYTHLTLPTICSV
eukprot:10871807-Alexandrium_andersonii.AAC.1